MMINTFETTIPTHSHSQEKQVLILPTLKEINRLFPIPKGHRKPLTMHRLITIHTIFDIHFIPRNTSC